MSTQEEHDTLNSLRSGIESEHRFKTVFRGYDKNDVKAFVEELEAAQEAARSEMTLQLEALRAERDGLALRVAALEAGAEEIRAEERARIANESSIREGVVASLRAENAQLVEENRQRQMEIASYKDRLNAVGEGMVASADELDALYKSLGELLEAKFAD